ncbi:hypothetical protein [Vibrio sp. D431a]|uniref:hypothetical protein n=1 Tax=Vibrio sp. D431a TaxID=2837388 RepID=UPI00255298CF|nr:hypothetical protein [Vibrio sp. D431a]MDK9789778.1 hypothetical protein [Vibrio sp. D431a]
MDKAKCYLIVSLGDSDFNQSISLLKQEISENKEVFFGSSVEQIKVISIRIMLAGFMLTRSLDCKSKGVVDYEELQRLENYFERKLKVYFSPEWVELDHDGSAVIFSYWAGEGYLV